MQCASALGNSASQALLVVRACESGAVPTLDEEPLPAGGAAFRLAEAARLDRGRLGQLAREGHGRAGRSSWSAAPIRNQQDPVTSGFGAQAEAH